MADGIVCIGAGGHAKVCIELLVASGATVAYCISGAGAPSTVLGIPVLEGDEHLERLAAKGHTDAFVAIGDNRVRERIGRQATALGYRLVNAISPQATVSPSARLGAGVAIMAGVVINAAADIGDLVVVNTGASVDHDCVIGTAVHLAPKSTLCGNVHVGERSFVAAGSTVIPGVNIGHDTIIGAGSAVIRDIPDSVTAFGVPARPVKRNPT